MEEAKNLSVYNAEALNIYQRMLAAAAEIDRVAKNLKVDISSKQSYKAVAEADVLEAVKPIEEKYGIYSYPYARKIIKDEVITTKSTFDNKITEKNTLFMRIETVYRFVNINNPQEYIDITTYGDGVDTQDKAPGKAMTYADKYALLKAYKIQTGDDPDAEASKDIRKPENKPVAAKKQNSEEVHGNAEEKPLTLKEAMQMHVQFELKGEKKDYRLGSLDDKQLGWVITKFDGKIKEAAELIKKERFKSALEAEQGEIPFVE